MNLSDRTQSQLIRFILTAKRAGCPSDQIERFVRSGYIPTPKQLEFHAAAREADAPGGPTRIALGGARGPGKSHATVEQAADDCMRRNELKGLFLRKVQKNAKESLEDLIRRAYRNIDHQYIPSSRMVVFPNGSRVLFGGYKDENDIDGYVGIEYDFMVIEEANQLTGRKHDLIRGSLRTSRQDWRPRIYLTFNPGGVGHQYMRNEFVLPMRAGPEAERMNKTRFIFSNYKDNPFLDEEYILWLEKLPGPLGRAWRDGDMDTFEGQAFPTWDYNRHTIEPEEIPGHWSRYVGMDWGSASPACVLWGARNPDNGRWIVYRELYINPAEGDTPLTDRQMAQRVVEMKADQEKILKYFADPSIWEKKELEEKDESTAKVYMRNGLRPLEPANNDRLGGKRRVDRLLADLPDGRPGLLVFRTCTNLIRTLPLLSFDDRYVEDVDTDLEDHPYDALRYLTTPAKEKTDSTGQPEDAQKRKQNPWMKEKNL